MAALDVTAFQAKLKQIYTREKIADLTMRAHPFWAMLKKTTDFGGLNYVQPIDYGRGGGPSASFTTARSNATGHKSKAFSLSRKKLYDVAKIEHELIMAAESDQGAFMRAAEREHDTKLQGLVDLLAYQLFRAGTGSIGRLSATSGVTTSLTLADPNDIVAFEEGMVLRLSTADGGGSLKTGTTTVTDVNRETGVITVDTSIATFTAAGAVNDYIFPAGIYDNVVEGLLAWLPASAPGATAFNGVDRTADVTRLGGLRFDASALSIEEGLIKAAMFCAREKAKPRHAFLNDENYGSLLIEIGSKLERRNVVEVSGKGIPGKISFPSITIAAPWGDIDVVADSNCPSSVAFMLDMETWAWRGLGDAPMIFMGDGLKSARADVGDAMGIETWMNIYGDLGCSAPGKNCHVKLA